MPMHELEDERAGACRGQKMALDGFPGTGGTGACELLDVSGNLAWVRPLQES